MDSGTASQSAAIAAATLCYLVVTTRAGTGHGPQEKPRHEGSEN
jgi:hypothetical protein